MLVLKKADELGVEVRDLLRVVQRKDVSLARQLRRAMQGVILNASEARHARGRSSAHKFSIAYGELKEVEAARCVIVRASRCGATLRLDVG